MKRQLIITLVFICSLLFYNSCKADDKLNALLDGKIVTSSGTCHLDIKGELARTEGEAKSRSDCLFIIDPKNEADVYFLLFKGKKLILLLKVARNREKQEVLWRNQDGMV